MMRPWQLQILQRTLIAAIIGLFIVAPAHGDGLRWEINSFDVTIQAQPDGTLDITERIVADFTREPHRGIIREIPYAYRRGGTDFKLRLDVKQVIDDSGQPHPYTVWRENESVNIRIGDPNRFLRAAVVYRIHYTVKRGLLGFDTHDELYWNATGNKWPVPIKRASCEVILPDGTVQSPEDARTASFLGPFGSVNPGPDAKITNDHHIHFEVDQRISPWMGLTIVVGFPKGHVKSPDAWTRAGWFLFDNSILLAPLIVFGLLLLLWRGFGRDRGSADSIVVQYRPPDHLSPVEVGALIDERVDDHDVTATIIDLAVRGYLKIDVPMEGRKSRVDSGRIRLIRREKNDSDLKKFEREILTGLFAGEKQTLLSSLETKFYTTMRNVRAQVYEGLSIDGYFAGRIPIVRGVWLATAVAMMLATAVLLALLLHADVFAPLSTIIAGLATIVLFPIFAWFMPRRTAKGRRALEHIKGLEEYIARAELPTLELAAQQEQFEKLLPYAMALRLSDVWARRFENLYVQPREWFDTHSDQALTTMLLMRHLNRSSGAMTRTLTAMPRTQFAAGGGGSGSSWSSRGFGGGFSGFSGGGGGGGFSGGGGGGGGGRGW